ncbi:MAG: hypothetical protein QNI84_10500 [Henriciella sp.]|nr:hypothetical protein [Henriciella sp.]
MSYHLQIIRLDRDNVVGAIAERHLGGEASAGRLIYTARQAPEILLSAIHQRIEAYTADGVPVSLSEVADTYPAEWAEFNQAVSSLDVTDEAP